MKTHFFATSAFIHTTGKTREEALDRLFKSHKRYGCPLDTYAWSCEVLAPRTKEYDLDFYQPVGVRWIEGREHNLSQL